MAPSGMPALTRTGITVPPEDPQLAVRPERRSVAAEHGRLILEEAGARTTPGASATPRGFTPGPGGGRGTWAIHQC
jgi:hypothetical protein